MNTIVIPCHACGCDNSIQAAYCRNCEALLRLRLRPVTTTQCISEGSADDEESLEALAHEAYLVAALLMQCANRLQAITHLVQRDDELEQHEVLSR